MNRIDAWKHRLRLYIIRRERALHSSLKSTYSFLKDYIYQRYSSFPISFLSKRWRIVLSRGHISYNNENHVRSLLHKRLIAITVITVISYGGIFFYNKAEAYKIANTPVAAVEVFFDGNSAGIVSDAQPIEAAISQISQQLKEYYNMDVVLASDVTFSSVAVKPDLVQDTASVISYIKSKIDFQVKAAVLVVNGQEVGIVSNRTVAESILDRIKQPYLDAAKDNPDIQDVRFVEDVQILDKTVEYSEVEDAETVYQRIMNDAQNKQIYEVKQGDTIWAIAKRYALSLGDIQRANPDIASLDKLQIGEKINLTVPNHLINVETVERVKYSESIPYKTVYQDDSSLYKNQTKLVQSGIEGQKDVTADIIKRDGVEYDRVIVSATVVREPTDQIIAKGTKAVPSYVATGNIGLPARGTITSRFGYRGGEFHTGVDIAAPIGTPIYAADSGKVIWAGWDGDYGRLVKIDHGNGLVTYYAHTSKIVVEVGQKVAKGQLIAYVGSSGRSTGPHVHFEVRKNGVPINPLR